jgi:hypothetical protein
MTFQKFKKQFQSHVANLIKDQTHLYQADVSKDQLWDAYLNSFSIESRQEHNCNACRQFIKNYGNVITIKNGSIQSIWDFESDSEYSFSIKALNDLVLSSPIKEVFVTKSSKLGIDSNFDLVDQIKWDHLFYELPSHFVDRSSKSEASVQGQYRDSKNVLKRSLDELTIEATETILDLISENTLYRGAESENLLKSFLAIQKEYSVLSDSQKDLYCWSKSVQQSDALSRIRNTSIGTLLIDISNSLDLDEAVAKFERVMAPANYKRPKAVFSKKMVEEAEQKIAELGLSQSLGRRFATKEDITINNLLFADRSIRQASSIFDELKEDVLINPKKLGKVQSVSINDFLSKLSLSSSLSLLLESRHQSNLVSLIAPISPDAPTLFKWSNAFSWSYNNALADSELKAKVRDAGGNVEGILRISLGWANYDDLDLHLIEPNGNKIYYNNKRSDSGGFLDVDMNASSGTTRKPVENIIYSHGSNILEGKYQVVVHNYSQREYSDRDFFVEIECGDELVGFNHQNPNNQEQISIVSFTFTKKDGIQFNTDVKSKFTSKEIWGLGSNKFHKVTMALNSPNHWANEIGNKHVFFMLDGAKNTGDTRGFFNEFLPDSLLEQKRVFEALSSKLRVAYSDNQLSGLGFALTAQNDFVAKVDDKLFRVLLGSHSS